MSVQLVLKNSSVQDKEVTASQVAVGEIALNYHQSGPFLQCKDTSGAVWRLGGVVIDGTEPSSPSKGAWWLNSSSGRVHFYDGSTWIQLISDQVAASEITEGTARQLLQTNAAGNGSEWASDIDIPGTLDVTGVATFDNNVVITGNLTVNGTTTTIDTTTLVVEDKNIELGVVGTPTDTTADGGGITVKGATDKTLTWVNSTGMWTSNQPFDVAGEVQCESLDVDGAADISGDVTLHANLDLQDDDKILLGTDDDLEIYHDGTNSIVSSNTGDLYIQTNGAGDDIFIRGEDDVYIQVQKDTGVENAIICNGDGDVQLYYNNAKKLATTDIGIDVTGSVSIEHQTGYGQIEIGGPSGGLIDLKGPFSDDYDFRLITTGTGGQIDVGGNNLSLVGHFIAGTSNTYDLGTSSVKWRDAYFDGTVNCDGASINGQVTIAELTATAGSFDLSLSNHWTCGAIIVPNPTNQVAGQLGFLRVTAAPSAFGANWKHPGGSYTAPSLFPAVAPFYVVSSGTILLGNWTEGIV